MKRIFLLAACAASVFTAMAQNDPVIMKIAGKDIPRSEFEYFFYKNNADGTVDKATLAEYADLFINFKLKVAAAEEAGLDTTASFLSEYKEYRGMQAEDYLIDEEWLEAEAHATFEESRREVGPDGLLNVGMISIMPRSTDPAELDYAKFRIDSTYRAILDGADFNETAARVSQDAASRRGGMLGWTSKKQLPEEISEVVFRLKPGEMSSPFFSDYGWQIFKAFDRRSFDNFGDHRDDIYSWMENNGYREQSMKEKAMRLSKEKGWNLDADAALAREDSLLESMYPEFALLSQEYHDGLLLFDISTREVWDKASQDTAALVSWFESHRSDYKYDKPHFKGMILFCTDESVFHELEKKLENVPESEWLLNVVSYNENDVKARVLRGPFAKGENAYCDKVVFGEGECTPITGYPYMGYIGRITEAPERWEDVSGQVINDIQDNLEKEWVNGLRKTHKFKVYKKVLATVGQ